jgi:hypothetical protein
MKALIIPTESKPYITNVDGGYKELQSYVGGIITSVDHPSNPNDARLHHSVGFSGYVNDEGLVLGLPYNSIASVLFGLYLCGDCVVTGGVDDDGNDMDVNNDQITVVNWHLNVHRTHLDRLAELAYIKEAMSE